jgi:uncharacterized membrane protein YkoI
MAKLNIPIKASSKEAKSMIAQKLKDKTLSIGDQRRLMDQYQEYAKGGDVKKKQQEKVGKVMAEFKEGTLHSGKGGKVVKSPKQAVAIALSEAGAAKPKKKK